MNVGAKAVSLAGIPITAVLLVSCGGTASPSGAGSTDTAAESSASPAASSTTLSEASSSEATSAEATSSQRAPATTAPEPSLSSPRTSSQPPASQSPTATSQPRSSTPKSQPPPAPPPNPNPPPGTMSYDLPGEGQDYSNAPDWEDQLAGECTDQGHEPDCVTLEFDVYLLADDGSTLTPLPGVGPDYAQKFPDRYETCETANIPAKGKVQLGSVIFVEIDCTAEPSDDSSSETTDTEDGG